MSIPQRVKPDHKAIEDYYAKLKEMRAQKARHEGAVSMAFYQILNDTAGTVGWIASLGDFAKNQNYNAISKTVLKLGKIVTVKD